MPLTIEQIVEETRSLPREAVAELVDRIWAAHYADDEVHRKAWSETIQRRVEEIRSGKVQGVPGDEVSERIRKIVGR